MSYVSHGNGPYQTEFADPNSPYEIAVRKVERYTKTSRASWEHIVNHCYNRAVLKLAYYLSGVKFRQNPNSGRGFNAGTRAPVKRPKATPAEPSTLFRHQGVTLKHISRDDLFD